jgi:hypothetical protein
MDIYPDSEAAKSISEISKNLNNDMNNHVKGTLQFFLGGLLKTTC